MADQHQKDDKAIGITKIKVGDIAPLVVVVGDPARAKLVSDLMEGATQVAANREYHTYTGKYKGKRVTVASHGVGGGGASMCFEELIKAGAKVIIRAGTCGSFQPELKEGSLVIATAAVRRDGVTDLLIHKEFPAVAHHTIINTLEKAASAKAGLKWKSGIIVTEGAFYDGVMGNNNALWAKTGLLAVEMEASVLFVIASLRGIRAGCILNVDNYIMERLAETNEGYQPHRKVVQEGTAVMCQIVLDAIVELNV